jgi:spermidine synthase
MTFSKKAREAREYYHPSVGIFFKVKKWLYSRKSPFQKIEVFENDCWGRVLLLDGLVQTTERDEFFYHEMLVHPALACHPAPQKVLIIGGGDGGALKEVLRYPVRRILLVEIDAQVIEVSRKYFPWLNRALSNKKVEVLIGDGRAFAEAATEKFDVILVDSSDPVGPSVVLHQQDFYRGLRNCLRPGGVVTAQAGSLLFHQEHLKKLYPSLKRLFRQAHFYTGPVPTYPGGTWVYAFLSDAVDPTRPLKKKIPSGLRYYNAEVHRAAFALPSFLK